VQKAFGVDPQWSVKMVFFVWNCILDEKLTIWFYFSRVSNGVKIHCFWTRVRPLCSAWFAWAVDFWHVL
jgi:hypothetical protein